MKSVVIALCTFVAATAAQGSPNLAACGQTCATNMLDADKADELGCKQNDLKCLCANKNFLYGLRDCSAAICSAEDAKKVVEYGISICSSAGVAIQTKSEGGNGGASNTGSIVITGASTIATDKVSTIFSTLTSDGETITTGIATTTVSSLSGGSASSNTDASGQISTIATTVTESNGSVETKTSEITLSGSATTTGTGAHQTESVVLTTVTSHGSAIVETLTTLHKSSESETASVTETVTKPESSSGSGSETTATDTGSSSASTTSTSTAAGVPQKTAGPVGIIAAAGLAMLML
ncbi:glycoside hydrolase family 18 protein [Trichoderma evansii]